MMRLERVPAEERIRRERVGPESGHRTPRGRRLADEGLRICAGGHRHVAALAVGEHEQPVLARRRDGRLESAPPVRPEALEAGELRLDRDACRPGRLDRRAAVAGHCLPRAPASLAGVGARRRLGLDRDRPQA